MKTDNDILLVSDFGRSAQGWLSYMLCYILNARFIEPYNLLNGATFTNSEIIRQNTNGKLLNREKTKISLVVKTHEMPDRNKFNLTKHVIFLTRDPRDVAVSYYYLNRRWFNDGSRSPFVIMRLLPFINYLYIAFMWKQHFKKWENTESIKVTYEQMRIDIFTALKLILHKLEIESNDELIHESIDIFSYENTYKRKRGVEDKNNPEARKGQIGDYRNHFGPLSHSLFWLICGKEATKAGYFKDGRTTVEPKTT